MLDHEFRPPSLRPVKRDEQQVKVDRQGVHGDHLHGTGADDVGQVLRGEAVVIDPGSPSVEMAFDAKLAPVLEFALDVLGCGNGLKPEAVAGEVQGVASRVTGHVEAFPESGQRIRGIALGLLRGSIGLGPIRRRGRAWKARFSADKGRVRRPSWLISPFSSIHGPFPPHPRQQCRLVCRSPARFPGGVNSPVRAFGAVGGTPLFIDRGEGAHIWDADGQRYIDFCCSWGPLILGHAHPVVQDRILKAVADGTSFGTPTRLENELGGMILDHHPYAERIRFVSSGTEAAMSAIRLARGVTGKTKILKFEGCYHGHVDALLVKAGSGLATLGTSTSASVPEAYARETLVLPAQRPRCPRGDHEGACGRPGGGGHRAHSGQQWPAHSGPSFLQGVRDLCDKYGVLLLFDEVISGFRVAFGGAAEYYGIRPDVMAFGKIIGGGMPVGRMRLPPRSWTTWPRWARFTRRAP